MAEQKPSVGRIVHYNDDPYLNAQDPHGVGPDRWLAALIVAVHSNETVNLVIWDETGGRSFRSVVAHGTGRYQWRWPPRV